MENNIVVDFSPPIPYMAKVWFLSYEPKCCQPVKYLKKEVNDEVCYWHADKN